VTAQRFDSLLNLTFRGERFDGQGIQLAVLPALVALNDVLQDLAHYLWRQKGGKGKPDKDDALDIRLHRLVPGNSITAEIIANVPLQLDLFSKLDSRDLRAKLVEAAVVLGDACAAYHEDPTSIRLPPEIWPSFLRMFGTMGDEEELLLDVTPARGLLSSVRPTTPIKQIVPPREQQAARTSYPNQWAAAETDSTQFVRFMNAPFSQRPRAEFGYSASHNLLRTPDSMPIDIRNAIAANAAVDRIEQKPEPPAAPVVLGAAMKTSLTVAAARAASTQETVTGEVRMASVNGHASVRIDKREIRVSFRSDDEKTITRALHEHDNVRVRIRGVGEIDLKTGRLIKIVAEKVRIIEPTPAQAITEERLQAMATDSPDELLKMIAGNAIPVHMLSFAAEYAGASIETEKVVPVLLMLLKHSRPTVREGAVYGLKKHRSPEVMAALGDIARNDHPILREIAEDALESMVELMEEPSEKTSEEPPKPASGEG
jgi:hypothetical protein